MKCPACNSSKYENGYCRNCGFVNRKLNEDDYVVDEKEKISVST